MKEVLQKLEEWRDNIGCDINADWPTLSEKLKMNLQMVQLMNAIAILNTIGENNNIPE